MPLRLSVMSNLIRISLILISFTLLFSNSAHASRQAQEVLGDWRFGAVLDGVDITSIDEKQAHELIGKVMTVGKHGIRFGDQRCGAPSFDSKLVQPEAYLRQEANINAKKLRLPDPVTVYDLGCTRIFVTKRNQGVIFWDGFFFRAKRVR